MLCFMITRLTLYTTFTFLKNEIIKYTVSCILYPVCFYLFSFRRALPISPCDMTSAVDWALNANYLSGYLVLILLHHCRQVGLLTTILMDHSFDAVSRTQQLPPAHPPSPSLPRGKRSPGLSTVPSLSKPGIGQSISLRAVPVHRTSIYQPSFLPYPVHSTFIVSLQNFSVY